MAQPNLNEAYLHVFNRMPSEVVDEGLTLRERDLELILDFLEIASTATTCCQGWRNLATRQPSHLR